MDRELKDPEFDLAGLRRLFPITQECVYFNHAATGPMSLPARRAIEECIEVYSKRAEYDTDEYFSLVAQARSVVARLINAQPEEIVLTHNTSQGIFIALSNLPLVENDVVLVMEDVFPAVRYIVDNNLPNIEKRFVSFIGKDPVEAVKANMTGRVKAVVVDHVQFLSGETIDLERLADFTRRERIYLVVDGIQGIGAMEFDVSRVKVDFVACGGAKWLFGPSGTGFLYIHKRNFEVLRTQHSGWLGAPWPGFEDFTHWPRLYPDARKYEMGTRNIMGIRGFAANIEILLEYGMNNVQARITALRGHLRRSFEKLGLPILTSDRAPGSGIVTVGPLQDAKGLHRHLRESGIVVSLRDQYIRFSPHFYNTEGEVDRIVAILARCRG
ncbi:aminotransferase class V-fold PLP-dependent enzyme [candidate division WOR-3 bacterium]|nr:aminotransferase class V-fold PLP-dependent enzyme [candidate division WOR-3 bacterium]